MCEEVSLKIALGIEYDGNQFYGWQHQPDLRTVQGVLEKAISQIATSAVKVTCAGRTDTGVHGLNQVVHFDVSVDRPLKSWIYGTNSHLPKDVVVKWAKEVPTEFDARFSAISRRYRYIIYNNSIRAAHLRSLFTWHYNQLDAELMHQEAQLLLGKHDFTTFRSSQCQANTAFRTIHDISVSRKGDLIFIDIEANAFLHHMVRNIAGVLMTVGNGRESPGWVKTLLECRDRSKGAETAPPYGLYLYDIFYPESFNIPRNTTEPLFISKPFGSHG